MTEVTRLHAEDFDECFGLMSNVFGGQNGRETDFTKELPKMCVRDGAHMGKHFGIRDGKKLISVLGVYPLQTYIAGKKLLFATVGNMVTLPEYEGKGCMGALYAAADEELARLGADAARLGGFRQRYNRFGYETAGTLYNFEIDRSNTRYCHKDGDPLMFSEIMPDDTEALKFADMLYRTGGIFVDRTLAPDMRDVYTTMIAWRSKPYIAKRADGTPVGYFCLAANGTTVNEVFAINEEQLENIIFTLQAQIGKTVTVSFAPARREAVKYFSSIAGASNAIAPSLFYIRDFVKLADALMLLKHKTFPSLPDGSISFEIEGYGALSLYAHGDDVGAEKVKSGKYKLSYFQAVRLLFGPYPPLYGLEYDSFAAAYLPLPLSWSTLDRV